MMHSDPDVLAAVAMGEMDVAADDLRHIETCDDCAGEIRSLGRIADLARSGPTEGGLDSPSIDVWNRISATLGLKSDIVPESVRSATSESRSESDTGPLQLAPATDLRRHRSTRRRRAFVIPVSIAASAALIAGAIGAVALAQRPSATLLADVSLKPLPEWTGSTGDARIETASDGQRDVVVTLATSAATASDYHEVWLISADLTKLVSVGVLSDGEGSFAIPAGVDLRDYPIVDVSLEKVDGNPAHSGDSIVRGEIPS